MLTLSSYLKLGFENLSRYLLDVLLSNHSGTQQGGFSNIFHGSRTTILFSTEDRQYSRYKHFRCLVRSVSWGTPQKAPLIRGILMSTRSEAEVVNTGDQEQPGVSQQPSSPTINPLNPNGQPSGIGDQTTTAKNEPMRITFTLVEVFRMIAH